MAYPITRQFGPNAKGSELTFADMDNNLLYLDAKVTGSNNYITLFSGSNAVSSSVIYQNSNGNITINGTVGIGVSPVSSSVKLTVAGEGTGSAEIGPWSSGASYTAISLNGSGNSITDYNFLSSPNDTNLYINRPAGTSILFREGNGDRMIISSSGNVGIGTTSPNAKLAVNGNTNITGSLNVTNGITGSLLGTSSNAVSSSFASSIGLLNQNITITGSGSLAPTIRLNNTSSNSYYDIANTGNLFINRNASTNGMIIASGSGGGSTVFTTSSITLEDGVVQTYTTTNFGAGTYNLTYNWNGGDDIKIFDGSSTGSMIYMEGYGTPPLTSSFIFTTTNGYITFRTEGYTTSQVIFSLITISSLSPNIRIGINKASDSSVNATGLDISGSLVVSGSTLITDVLTLPQVSPLPSGRPTGSLAVSGSGTACKIYFFNGSWNALF